MNRHKRSADGPIGRIMNNTSPYTLQGFRILQMRVSGFVLIFEHSAQNFARWRFGNGIPEDNSAGEPLVCRESIVHEGEN